MKEYVKPEIVINNFDKEEVLTVSTILDKPNIDGGVVSFLLEWIE